MNGCVATKRLANRVIVTFGLAPAGWMPSTPYPTISNTWPSRPRPAACASRKPALGGSIGTRPTAGLARWTTNVVVRLGSGRRNVGCVTQPADWIRDAGATSGRPAGQVRVEGDRDLARSQSEAVERVGAVAAVRKT